MYQEVAVLGQYLIAAGCLVIPLTMSLIYNNFNFTTALDTLSILIGLNGVGFVVHSILKGCGREQSQFSRVINIDKKKEG